jgi:uncharacterized protein YkwD
MKNVFNPTGRPARSSHSTLRSTLTSTGSKALCASLLMSFTYLSASAQTPIVRPAARLLSTTSSARPAGRAPLTVIRAASTVVATGAEQRAFEMVNAERRAGGAAPLIWDAELCLMARLHSENMARLGFFAHTSPDGTGMTTRAQAVGIRGWSEMGENIAYNQGFDDPAAFAVARWMQSTKHRENILNAGFTYAGLGIARADDGRIFFTQVFIAR